jgi:hypothetical protein
MVDEKYWEGKGTGLFIDVATELSKTDRTYQGTTWTTSPNVNVSILENPDTSSKFYVLKCVTFSFLLFENIG